MQEAVCFAGRSCAWTEIGHMGNLISILSKHALVVASRAG